MSVDVDGEGSCNAAEVELSVRADVAGGIDIAVVPEALGEVDADSITVGGFGGAFWSGEVLSGSVGKLVGEVGEGITGEIFQACAA